VAKVGKSTPQNKKFFCRIKPTRLKLKRYDTCESNNNIFLKIYK